MFCTGKLAHLGKKVELDHGIGEGVSICPEVGNHAQHGSVERAVDLLQAGLTGIVHVNHRDMTQKPAQRFFSCHGENLQNTVLKLKTDFVKYPQNFATSCEDTITDSRNRHFGWVRPV
jgi:hypothetical protein